MTDTKLHATGNNPEVHLDRLMVVTDALDALQRACGAVIEQAVDTVEDTATATIVAIEAEAAAYRLHAENN